MPGARRVGGMTGGHHEAPNPYARTARAEARLRLALARSMLRLQKAGAVDAALAELVRIVLGQDAKGQPIAVPHRTRAQAAASLARLVVSVASLTRGAPTQAEPAPPGLSAPATPVERVKALPGETQAWLRDVVGGLNELGLLPASTDPAPPAPHNGMPGGA